MARPIPGAPSRRSGLPIDLAARPAFTACRDARLRRAAALAVSLMAIAEAVQSAHADIYGFFGATETLPAYGAHPTGMYSGTNGVPPIYAYNLAGSFGTASNWDDYSQAYYPTEGDFALQAPGPGDTVYIGGLPAGWETPTEGPSTTDSSGDPVYGYYGLTQAGYYGGNGFDVTGASGTIADLYVSGPGTLSLGGLNATDSATIESIGAIPLVEFTANGGFTFTGVVGSLLTVSGGSLSTDSLSLCAATDLSVQGADPVTDAGSLVFNGATVSGDTTQVYGVPQVGVSPNDAYNAQPVALNSSTLEADTELDIVGIDPVMYPNATGTTTLIVTNSDIVAGSVVIATGSLGFGSGSPLAEAELDLTDGSSLTTTNDGLAPVSLVVGDTGDGTLTAEDGSQINTNEAIIGNEEFSSGNAMLDGSSWENTGTLTVGNYGLGWLTVTDGATLTSNGILNIGFNDGGEGTLVISDGATVTTDVIDTPSIEPDEVDASYSTVVGAGVGSEGTITIDGDNSQLESMGNMAIGDDGSGFVALTNGAALVVDGAMLEIGHDEGSEGELDVLGIHSSLAAVNGELLVGDGGDGALIVNGGGTLSAGSTSIGSQETGTGTFIADGSGTQASLGDTVVGDSGNGNFSATGGATVNIGDFVFGEQDGGYGFAYISDTSTRVTAGDLTVGGAGNGEIFVLGNATLLNQDAILGRDEDSSGDVLVSGSGSVWHSTGEMNIGQSGDGQVYVEDGATLQVDGDLTLGTNEEGTGILTIDGSSSQFNYGGGDVTVGSSGAGTINVQDGAYVNLSGNDMTLGDEGSGEGALLVTDPGTIVSTGDLTVGGQGDGTLTVQNSGLLSSAGSTIGDEEDSSGAATVTGSGSTWTTADLTVGGGGSGELNIDNGGVVNVSSELVIGDEASGNGIVTLGGAGSQLNLTGELKIGESGTGVFAVQGAASFTASMVMVADQAHSVGALNVDGTGTVMRVQQDFNIGENGNAYLNVTNGASLLSTSDATLADMTGSSAAGTINAGSIWAVGGDLTIGHQGIAMLIITGGSSVTANNLVLGEVLGSAGTVTIQGSGSYFKGSSLNVGGSGTVSGGNGAVTISQSGAATISGNLTIWNTASSVNVAGGALGVGSLTSNGSLAVSSGSLAIAAGLTNNGTAAFSGGSITLATINGTGTLNLSNGVSLTATHVRQGTLGIASSSAITIADSPGDPGNPADTSIVTAVSAGGTLNLSNNDLIVTGTAQYSSVKSAIVTAYDGGSWNGPGITSSSARANTGSYGLGYATATEAGTTSFDGQNVSGTQTLVKYTLLGDTQLRGTVGLGDYDTVLSNYGQPEDWSGGDFHYAGVVGIGDYDDVLSNYGAHASGNLTTAPALTSAVTRGISPDLAKTDLKLEVNTATGDVYVLATASTAFTGYTISDPTVHLLGGSTSPDPDKLLSVSAQSGGNTNIYETSGTYVNWFKITETASQVAEGQQQNGFGTHSSRDDTINIPAGGTIDFGEIYNTAAAQQDLTFDFAEAGTEPTNGPTYYGAEVDYVTTPEPASVSVLAIGAMGILSRRRRRNL